MNTTASPRYRSMRFGVTEVEVRNASDGVQYVRGVGELAPPPERITDRLLHWAEQAPGRTLFARRQATAQGARGEWEHISYAQAVDWAQRIGQALLMRGLGPERPVVILSENSLEHAMLALACVYVGVPYCPVSPAYALISQDFEKLRHILQLLQPGMVFASDAQRYGKAIMATVAADAEVVLHEGSLSDRPFTLLAELMATPATPAVDAAMRATGPDTVVKFLFTSGSTKLPKGVINTQRMWCANQQQMCQSMPLLSEAPPVLVDWLPWNHTFGGNHNVGLTIYNGGTLYIDDGKPTPALMGETLRNLREVAPTIYFNVPTGFEAISNAMQTDDALRRNLLSRVRMFFYSGAALAQPIWDRLHAAQEREIGERIVMGTGLGMTESGPFAVFVPSHHVRAGDLGLPTVGMTLKLVPMGDKTEVRYHGPNITPGYWRSPQETADAFDEEGYFCTGDAVQWIDPGRPELGLKFDGRIAEDFKLATGTFVSVGPLRAKIIAAAAPYVQDAVITGLNLNEVGAMLFPTPALRGLAGLDANASMAEVVASPPVQVHFQTVINQLAAQATGSANRVVRAIILTEPPSIDKGEVTDKGSINQRAVLKHRDALVHALHAGEAPHTWLAQA